VFFLLLSFIWTTARYARVLTPSQDKYWFIYQPLLYHSAPRSDPPQAIKGEGDIYEMESDANPRERLHLNAYFAGMHEAKPIHKQDSTDATWEGLCLQQISIPKT
jgi:hypothetical protein